MSKPVRFLVLVACAAFVVSRALVAVDLPRLEVPQQGATVTMDDIGGRPLVDVVLNGKGPFPFILDTGADETVVDVDLASELALPAAKIPLTPHEIGPAVMAEELRLGTAAIKDIRMSTVPITQMFHTEKKPRGVLSAAAFPGYLLVLDYPGKKVRVAPGELETADGRRIFQYTKEDVLPTVTLHIADQEVRTHIDAGSPGGVTLPNRYMKTLPLASEPFQIGHARTPHGESVVMGASLSKPVELGEYRLEVSRVSFSDLQAGEVSGMGNVGAQVLKDFVVTLDAKNHRIRLER